MQRIKRKRPSFLRRGFSLIEVMVVASMFSVITTALVIFYQSANIEFSQSMETMTLAQQARQVATKIVPYASAAVPNPSVSTTYFIYSPALIGGNSVDPAVLPNIYNLDFVTATNLLSPGDQGQITNCRAQGVTYYRYRIRFDPSTGKLWLENLSPTAAAPVSGGTCTTPTANTVPAARLLGRDLQQVTFNNDANSIQVTITTQSILRSGAWMDATVHRSVQGHTHAVKQYTLFSTVMIPYYSGQ